MFLGMIGVMVYRGTMYASSVTVHAQHMQVSLA
jgi:hypothetical protein